MADSISRQLIIKEAKRRGFRVETLGQGGYYCKVTAPDGRWEMFRGTRPMRTSANGAHMSRHKDLTMVFVKMCGYRVPEYAVVDDADQARAFLKAVAPIVVKPLDGAQSRGVTVGVATESELLPALERALDHAVIKKAVLQRQLHGKLYRL